jgi:proteasome lid subunit RPN8/RPN11
MTMTVSVPKVILEMILESAKHLHPRETILLLRGKSNKNVITISEIIIPPLSTYGQSFSAFQSHMLPMDFSIIGAAHSHPSGNPTPSSQDLNHSMGKILLIVAYPYLGKDNAVVYDRNGERLTLEVT